MIKVIQLVILLLIVLTSNNVIAKTTILIKFYAEHNYSNLIKINVLLSANERIEKKLVFKATAEKKYFVASFEVPGDINTVLLKAYQYSNNGWSNMNWNEKHEYFKLSNHVDNENNSVNFLVTKSGITIIGEDKQAEIMSYPTEALLNYGVKPPVQFNEQEIDKIWKNYGLTTSQKLLKIAKMNTDSLDASVFENNQVYVLATNYQALFNDNDLKLGKLNKLLKNEILAENEEQQFDLDWNYSLVYFKMNREALYAYWLSKINKNIYSNIYNDMIVEEILNKIMLNQDNGQVIEWIPYFSDYKVKPELLNRAIACIILSSDDEVTQKELMEKIVDKEYQVKADKIKEEINIKLNKLPNIIKAKKIIFNTELTVIYDSKEVK